MAHYALLNTNNVVTDVIVGETEGTDGKNWEQEYSQMFGSKCLRTSYNTYGGVHNGGGIAFRKNYAVIGGSYDPLADGFHSQQPYPSWVLNTTTLVWEAPYQEPKDEKNLYRWDEKSTQWIFWREIRAGE